MRKYMKPDVELIKFNAIEAIATQLPGMEGGVGSDGSDLEWGEDE